MLIIDSVLEGRRYREARKQANRMRFSHDALRTLGFYSQCGQDLYVASRCHADKRRAYVDVGAHDGITFSNTYWFERHWKWDGIVVEPNHNLLEKLRANRRCRVISQGVAAKPGFHRFTRLTGYSEMLSGLSEEYDKRHAERIRRERLTYGGGMEEVEISCLTLNDVFEEFGKMSTSYLSLDVEGAELAILRGFAFERFEVDLVGVENNYSDARVHSLMTRNGYRLDAIVGDEFYVREL